MPSLFMPIIFTGSLPGTIAGLQLIRLLPHLTLAIMVLVIYNRLFTRFFARVI